MWIRKVAVVVLLSLIAASVSAVAPATTSASQSIRKLLGSGEEASLDRAIELGEAEVERTPDSAEAHYWLGAAYGRRAQIANMFSAAGYARKVKAEFLRAVELDPRHVEAQLGLVQFYLQAPGFMGGDVEEAKRVVEELGKIDPVAGHRGRASLKFSEKDRPGAIAEWLAALKLDAANPDVLPMVVGVLAQEQRLPELEPIVVAAVQKDPGHPVVRYQAGKFAALSGKQLTEGLAHLDALLALPTAPEGVSLAGAHWRRGQILSHLKRHAEALAATQQAASLEPGSEEIKKSLEVLSKAAP
ncbi:MAG: tetratricopeptide repeat protein [Ahniella sp.]|nr:tetratricopeptide repeat protein [Ahniella sp.]